MLYRAVIAAFTIAGFRNIGVFGCVEHHVVRAQWASVYHGGRGWVGSVRSYKFAWVGSIAHEQC